MGKDEELLARLTPRMRDAGITRIANITGLDELGIPVVLAIRPNSRSLSVSQGKGVTLQAARISAVMESFEQFHAESCEVPVYLATHEELSSRRRVVDVHALPTVSPLGDEKILWATAAHLGTGKEVAVPFELVHLDMTLPLPQGTGHFSLGSNGLASGVALPDALAHGLCEVIERDALALFYERSPSEQAARRILLDTVDDACCSGLIRRFERAGLGVAVWDMTSDIGVATFLCSVGERVWDPLHQIGTARGYGCHPERTIALRRALTEAAQSRLTRIAGSRDDIHVTDLDHIRSKESIDHQRAHIAQESLAVRKFQDVPTRTFPTPSDVLAFACHRLEASGYGDPLYVDLSRRNWPISVARTIVPGLEGFPDAPTYVPGARALAIRSTARI